MEQSISEAEFSRQDARELLSLYKLEDDYRKHYFRKDALKILIRGGSMEVDLNSGEAYVEKLRRRPIFYEANFLHYNRPRQLWTWFSDFFAGALVILAISGLLILKGKNGFMKRGIWFTAIGLIIPLVFLYFYL